MYEPSYVTYVQNLSDEELVNIIKEYMAIKTTGKREGSSKLENCVAAVKDFFKSIRGCMDSEIAYTGCYLLAETTIMEEVFERYIEIHDTQSKSPCTNADKIRSMTDEELYDFLCSFASRYTDISSPCAFRAKLFYVMGWLKQPAKED